MCPSESFFGTDGFYLTTLHILTVVEFPVHLLGAFIVTFRTPKHMSSVKTSMLVLHVCCVVLDFSLSVLFAPVLVVPVCSGYPLGLSLHFNISTPILIYIGASLVCVTAVTILAFFEDRYHRLVLGRPSKTTRRKLYLFAHYLISFFFILPCYYGIPNQDLGKTFIREKIPCLPDSVLDRPGFYVLAIDNTIICICLGFPVLFISVQIFFYVHSTIQFLLKSDITKSEHTLRLQKQFFIALCIQVAVPIVVLVMPGTYVVMATRLEYFNQAWTNSFLLMVSFHGTLSTLTMLIVHKPYRNATLELFWHSKKMKRKTSDSKFARSVFVTSVA